jgi:hypothetical protein
MHGSASPSPSPSANLKDNIRRVGPKGAAQCCPALTLAVDRRVGGAAPHLARSSAATECAAAA